MYANYNSCVGLMVSNSLPPDYQGHTLVSFVCSLVVLSHTSTLSTFASTGGPQPTFARPSATGSSTKTTASWPCSPSQPPTQVSWGKAGAETRDIASFELLYYIGLLDYWHGL